MAGEYGSVSDLKIIWAATITPSRLVLTGFGDWSGLSRRSTVNASSVIVILTLKMRPSSCSSDSSNVPFGSLASSARETCSPKSMKDDIARLEGRRCRISRRSPPAACAPIRTEAIAAQTSPSSTSGMRELTLMMSITGRIGSPSEIILTAGRRSPSWKISVASPDSEPGAMPPTSELWAMLAVQAMIRSVGEDRHRDDDVVEMGDAAVIGIVGGEDVARARCRPACRTCATMTFTALSSTPMKAGMPAPDEASVALGVGDAGAHVEHLVDDRAHRRLPHGGEHLVGGRLQRVLDDFQRDRVVCVAFIVAPLSAAV